MISENTPTFSNQSISNLSDYIAHEREPIDNNKSFAPDEIKQELYVSRFFLKRRVWRNMEKIRRRDVKHTHFSHDSDAELRLLRPRFAK